MESKSQFESIWQVTFIIVFFSIISVNFWIPLTHIKDFNKLEYRQLSPLPTYESPKSIISYSKNFENYFNDHFSIRYRFIILNRKILVQIFDQKFLADVIRGKDNWLFWGWGSYKIKCQNASLLSQSELQEHLYVISNIHEELESQNIQLFFLIQPETCTIYPEYSEDVLPILGKQSMTDQYINYFQKNNPKIQFIDLRPDLIAAKDRYQLYYKTDTHWNDFGTYFGYRTIINNIFPNIPDEKLIDLVNLSQKPLLNHSGDLARVFLGLTDLYNEDGALLNYQNSFLTNTLDDGTFIIENPNAQSDLTLVFYHDSFYVNKLIQELLPNHFKRIIMFHSNKNLHWNPNIDELTKLIDQWHPDIILVERVERNFMPFGTRKENAP